MIYVRGWSPSCLIVVIQVHIRWSPVATLWRPAGLFGSHRPPLQFQAARFSPGLPFENGPQGRAAKQLDAYLQGLRFALGETERFCEHELCSLSGLPEFVGSRLEIR